QKAAPTQALARIAVVGIIAHDEGSPGWRSGAPCPMGGSEIVDKSMSIGGKPAESICARAARHQPDESLRSHRSNLPGAEDPVRMWRDLDAEGRARRFARKPALCGGGISNRRHLLTRQHIVQLRMSTGDEDTDGSGLGAKRLDDERIVVVSEQTHS